MYSPIAPISFGHTGKVGNNDSEDSSWSLKPWSKGSRGVLSVG